MSSISSGSLTTTVVVVSFKASETQIDRLSRQLSLILINQCLIEMVHVQAGILVECDPTDETILVTLRRDHTH